ncbi:hypothetical protein HNV08_09740 [Winogradskyella eckloniae]|uniref:hypothetical protein n=1 Tax=Winogradskyella eckloniae TaxID=1089306 RepID=UPI00156397A1|nr:hypothetical protein [Winogradskyella eckloniae]NRD20328.1 hypothetical protein [Winogradskyella eckloniae]
MFKIKKVPYLILISIFTISFYNCGIVKPKSTGKISKYVEDFFLGDGKMQYFVQPLDYSSTLGEDATLDATFRRADKKNDSVTVNFSVLLKTNSNINTVLINSIDGEYTTSSVSTFYMNKEESLILHRASIKLPYNAYQQHLLKENHTITVTSEDDTATITPTNKSNQKLESIIAILSDLL